MLKSKVKSPQDNAMPTSKGTSPELVKLGESVVSLRKNGDVYGSVLAMARLMQGWSPVGLSRQEAIKMLGAPDQIRPNGMIYRLDTGTGGCQWEFEIENNVISKVTKRLME